MEATKTMTDKEQEDQYYEELLGHEDPPEMVDESTGGPFVPTDPERPF
jgi:hypothetical protein